MTFSIAGTWFVQLKNWRDADSGPNLQLALTEKIRNFAAQF